MAYEYEIKSGQRVYIENTNGYLYKSTVININEYREPSMRVSLQVDGIEDIVFTGLENIKIMEDKKMTFETLTVIELLLSASNYPEDKCDKIRDELSTMDKKTKAFNKISDVIKKAKFYDRDTALDVIEIVDELEDTNNE